MDSDTPNPLQPATPQEARHDIRTHQRGLFRGQFVIGLGLILLVLFGAVTAAVLFLDPLSLDVPITREVQELQFGPADALLVAVSAPGLAPWNFVFPVVLALGIALTKRIAEAGFLLLASLATMLEEVVKFLVHRARPSADLVQVFQHLSSYSFPSGHVTQYTLVFGFCFYLAFTLMKKGPWRTLCLVLSGAMVVLVGPSRIWMGQHWASDVLGGYTLGFGLLLIIIWLYRTWEARQVQRQAANLPSADQPAIMRPTTQK